MTRYFPEVVEAIKQSMPERCVVDGEIIAVVGDRLEFEVLQQRIHPAASRIKLLSEETPAGLWRSIRSRSTTSPTPTSHSRNGARSWKKPWRSPSRRFT